MARRDVALTGVERFFDVDEVIVSKTDLKGRITYANRVFQRVAGYTEAELMGAPHSIVRHPDMPRCVFKLLWDTLGAGQEIFAYVVNKARNGDHYWVFAHVTPSYDVNGQLIGYHSSRRVPDRAAIDKVVPLYRTLLDIENKHADRKQGMEAAFAAVLSLLTEKGIGYDEFVFSL
ncbi:PAS domain-containing protein [Azospirillum soli]|uniref:PAS domain-containing protein n=1 Tax=Azospirillum soli TaxID=1304799 RepID=UPI001AE7E61F|nr:PAS domain-containing protein [Azospirillum soli]MBP2313159.1 PAS domain S-box-containing protein [Azospirillum soli]